KGTRKEKYQMTRSMRRTALVLFAGTLTAVGATAAFGSSTAKPPILIAASMDLSGQMTPFDAPALQSARLEAAKINAKGGVLGRKIVDEESYTSGDKTISSVISRINAHKADVIATGDIFADYSAEVAGLRSLGNNTPILNSWAGDGTFWYPKSPKVSNYWYVT